MKTKILVGIIALFVMFFSVDIVAEAAKEIARGVLVGTVSGPGTIETKVYKIQDDKNTCYVVTSLYGPSISCVK